MVELKTELTNLHELYEDAKGTADADLYEKLNLYLQDLQSELRDHLYASTAEQLVAILPRLQRGETMSAADRALLRVWVVEDAEKYMQMEGHFKAWVGEFEEILNSMLALRDAELDMANVGTLRALGYSGMRVLSDIMFYLRAARRVENFNRSLEEFTEQNRATLVAVLKRQLEKKVRG
ncbi:MAG: hypothetical protein K8I02_02815 [Candidatus Methylomirabilis sp.]|nr:hypothetical protein [Deltaproteobacteria bacterium]